jgi:hypothetical protein
MMHNTCEIPQHRDLCRLGLRPNSYNVQRSDGSIEKWIPTAFSKMMRQETVPHITYYDGEPHVPMAKLTEFSYGHDHALKFVSIKDLQRLNPEAGIVFDVAERDTGLQVEQVSDANARNFATASDLQVGTALIQVQAAQTLDTSIQALAMVSDIRKEQKQQGECVVFVDDE